MTILTQSNITRLETAADSHIMDAARFALERAKRDDSEVSFTLNGITIVVDPTRTIENIVNEYTRKWDANDWSYFESVEFHNKIIYQTYLIKMTEKHLTNVNNLIANEKMMLDFPLYWIQTRYNNQDKYGTNVLDYAERWAKLMQKKIANGEQLTRNLIERIAVYAKVIEMTKYAYDQAANILIACWRYGIDLGRAIGKSESNIAKTWQYGKSVNDELIEEFGSLEAYEESLKQAKIEQKLITPQRNPGR